MRNLDPNKLKKTLEMISKEENWTRYFLARDIFGNPCEVESTMAYCYCAHGALRAANASEFIPYLNELALKLHPRAADSHKTCSLIWVNDYLGYTAVIDLFTKALEELQNA